MINSALNFTGSKYKLLPQLLPKMDYTKDFFVDLFCGSFVVGSNVIDKYKKILANDIISELVGIHKGIIYNEFYFIDKVKKLVVSSDDKDGFNKLRENFNKDKTPEKLYALLLCSTNNMMRFNQKFQYNQTFGKRSYNSSTEEKLKKYIEHIQPYKNKIIFKSEPFYKININIPSMVYIDPPYGRIKKSDDSLSEKQISEAGYNTFWKKSDDIKLYEYIKNLDKNGSSFMVSGLLEHNGNICWMLDKLIYDGYKYEIIEHNYNKVSRKGNKKSKEIIILNYDI